MHHMYKNLDIVKDSLNFSLAEYEIAQNFFNEDNAICISSSNTLIYNFPKWNKCTLQHNFCDM